MHCRFGLVLLYPAPWLFCMQNYSPGRIRPPHLRKNKLGIFYYNLHVFLIGLVDCCEIFTLFERQRHSTGKCRH